jgi:hypothetical protein
MMNAEEKKKKKYSIRLEPEVRRAISKDWMSEKFFSLTKKKKSQSNLDVAEDVIKAPKLRRAITEEVVQSDTPDIEKDF